jgi:RNA polymerase sigma-70 factor (ECF subfamily)
VQKAIDRLPEQQREVVMLHDYQGLTHDQIAQIIGASHAAVRKRYSRALSALGETLTEWLP